MHYQPMKTKTQILNQRESRIRARKRLYILGFILVFILVSISIALLSSRSRASGRGEDLAITVYPGDTLWTIAAQYRGRTEIRRFIEEIRRLNNITDAHIHPGQVLTIPQGR
jgi:nucleoid-associated protein YgaU